MPGFPSVFGKVLGLVFALIGILIVFKVAAQMLPTVFVSIADMTFAFTNTSSTVNDTVGNAIKLIGGQIISIIAVLGVLFLILAAAGLGFLGTGGGRRRG